MLAEEGLEATRNIRDTGFRNLIDGTHGIALPSYQWILSGLQDVTDIYTRQVVISPVDSSTKLVTSTVTWSPGQGQTQNTSLSSYVSFWTTRSWYDTTTAHFTAGTIDNTMVTTTIL